MLVQLARRREQGPLLLPIPAHGRFGGREEFEVRRKRRLTTITRGKTRDRTVMVVRSAAGAASSKTAIFTSSLARADQKQNDKHLLLDNGRCYGVFER